MLALKRLANSNAAYAQADELKQPNVVASGLAANSGALQKASEVGWILFHLVLRIGICEKRKPLPLEKEN